jgi:phosphatidylglycerophosphatase A
MHGQTAAGVRGWKDHVLTGFVSVFFLGYSPIASGTVGSLPGIAIAYWLSGRPVTLLALAFIIFALGVPASSRAETVFGCKDPSYVTIDELAGMLIAFVGLPMSWSSAICIFLLFRIFDIFKPFPARQCERIRGGLGIMADDIVAGIYANMAFRLLDRFL